MSNILAPDCLDARKRPLSSCQQLCVSDTTCSLWRKSGCSRSFHRSSGLSSRRSHTPLQCWLMESLLSRSHTASLVEAKPFTLFTYMSKLHTPLRMSSLHLAHTQTQPVDYYIKQLELVFYQVFGWGLMHNKPTLWTIICSKALMDKKRKTERSQTALPKIKLLNEEQLSSEVDFVPVFVHPSISPLSIYQSNITISVCLLFFIHESG